MRLPPLPSDLRTKLGLAIVSAFEHDYRMHGASYNPDTCYRAADEVIAVLLTELTGMHFEAQHPRLVIGPAHFVATEEVER